MIRTASFALSLLANSVAARPFISSSWFWQPQGWTHAPPQADGGWQQAHATFYGGPHDQDQRAGGPTIHEGWCQFGHIDSNTGTGWDVAAFTDSMPNKCGACFEVKCRSAGVTDAYGQQLDRSKACTSGASVVVRITDLCPCKYSSNAYSNSRWCCGQANHIDLSEWAFAKIADLSQGVVAVDYREVKCP